MSDIIKHQGTVENIEGIHLRVKIVQTSACSACAAHKYCNSSESKEKIIDVYDKNASSYHVGEDVFVYGTTSMGMRAIFWAFAIPFLVMILTLFVTMRLTDGNEVLSSVVTLFSLSLYYLILYLLRGKMSKNFTFTIKSINN